jgi:hypothetical protein
MHRSWPSLNDYQFGLGRIIIFEIAESFPFLARSLALKALAIAFVSVEIT